MNSHKTFSNDNSTQYQIKEVLSRVSNPVDVDENQVYNQIGIRSHAKGIFFKEPVSGKELGNKRVFWVEPDCFIVNIVFAWERAIARTSEQHRGYIASHRFPMYKANEEIVDLDYITFLFKTKKGQYLLELASPGGAGRNKTLGQSEFGKLEVVLPSLSSQKKIVKLLLLLDRKKQKQKEKVEELELFKKGVLQKIFSHELRFKNEDGEEFPDWETRSLMDLGEFKRSYSFSRSYEGEGKYYHIHYGDIHTKLNSIIDTATELPKINVIEDLEELEIGDILFADASEDYKDLGKAVVIVNIENKKIVAGLHTHRFQPSSLINPVYLMYFTKTDYYSAFIRMFGTGVSVLGISKNNLGTLEIPVPSKEEQMKIADFLKNIDNKIKKEKEKLMVLEEQKRGFMQGMFV